MIFHSAHVIDNFLIHQDEDALPTLICDGWVYASLPVTRMSIEIGARSVPIEAFRLESPDVASYAGPDAGAARFRLECRIEPAGLDLAASRFVVEFEGGYGLTVALAEKLVITRNRSPADRDLVMRFESLGDNCEFGLMQRGVGIERLGLLRYGGARNIDRLVDAIENGFEGFATPDDLDLSPFGAEWVATSRRYGFTFHTRTYVHEKSEAETRASEATKLAFMAQMLREDLETGHKCFVRRTDEGEPEAGMWALRRAIAAKGPGRLLWVTAPTAGQQSGTVQRLAQGLYRGHHGALAPYGDAGGFDEAVWLSLLRAAEAAMAGSDAPDSPEPPTPLREGWWRRMLAPRAARPRELA